MTQIPTTPEDDVLAIGGLSVGPGNRIGPYVYERLIGRGGMAVVLLARDASGAPVALKVLRASRLATGQTRFRREFRALARLGHPNVVRVESIGDLHGHPFIAMEYVEGHDLHQEIRAIRNLPPEARWRRIEHILVDLCRAMAHIHRRGLVHRDLKPSNVLLDVFGRVKLTDFGIVKDLDPIADPNVSDTLVGTWAYASPEQMAGEPIDHRSDLYSMGVILFVLLTGQRPFVAKDLAGYLDLHRHHGAPRPRDRDPSVPAHLDEIAARLMSKNPRDRFQSAQEVLFRLEPDGAGIPIAAAPTDLPLVGRETESERLANAVSALTRGRGAAVLVLGPMGCGRTRLMDLALEQARRLGFPIHAVRGRDAQGGFGVLRRLAADLRADLGADLPPDLDEVVAAFEAGPVQGNVHHRSLDAVRRALDLALVAGPRVLAVDDLHEAPESVLDLVAFLCRTVVAQGQPLLVLGTVRTDAGGGIDERIVDPARLGVAPEVIRPGPLQLENVHTLLVALVGEAPGTWALAERLERETEGNPLFVAQFLGALRERRVLVQGPGGLALAIDTEEIQAGHLEIPAGIRALLDQRLAAVSQADRTVLEALAVHGQEMDLDLLIEVLDEPEDAVLDRVESLVDADLVEEHRSGPYVHLDLPHRKLGDILYRDLQPQRRLALHRRFATVLQARGPCTAAAVEILGEHYRRAGEDGLAWIHLAEAARRFHERSLFEEASRLADRASAVEGTARMALDEGTVQGVRLALLPVRGGLALDRGDWASGRDIYQEALDLARALGNGPETCRTGLRLAQAEERLGGEASARSHRDEALALARRLGDRTLVAEALKDLATSAWDRGDRKACGAWAAEGLVLAADPAQEGVRADLLLLESEVQACQGQVAAASVGLSEAEAIFGRLGLGRSRCLALASLAELHLWQDHLREALLAARQARGLAREGLFRMGQGVGARVAGLVCLELGRWDEAHACLAEALEVASALKVHSAILAARYALGRWHLVRGDPDGASRHLTVARGLASLGDPEGYLPLVQATIAHLLAESGDAFQARQILEQAQKPGRNLSLTRQVQSRSVVAAAYQRLGQSSDACRVANDVIRLARPRGLNLFVLDALVVLAGQEPDAAARRRAREEALQLTASVLADLPLDLATGFHDRPDLAALDDFEESR
ncbi:MAG: protein kinase [Deltaproteobacteria bacterium]|nr:protein kinase [Deltaproteobacteria bacterium]